MSHIHMSFERRLLDDLFLAYYEARRNKRNTTSQLDFEMDLEHNLIVLYEELLAHTYKPGPMVCFITQHPVRREIFASQFRDRVVHHLLFRYIAPIFERQFIYDSYSCRKGKGTLFGINRLDHHIRSCNHNYTQDAYVLKLDVKGYFMSINKQKLYLLIDRRLKDKWYKEDNRYKEDNKENINNKDNKDNINRSARRDARLSNKLGALVDYLVREIIFKDPTNGCEIRGSRKDWKKLPLSKTLFGKPKDIGLPIGDLTSQLFSNIYLGELDNYAKRTLKIKHYGRYVDDFFIVDTDLDRLKAYIPQMRTFLKDELGLTLHPRKTYLQHYRHGVPFLGIFIKPHRRYAMPRCIASFRQSMRHVNNICRNDTPTQEEKEAVRETLNSYCAYFTKVKAYKIMWREFRKSPLFKHFYFTAGLGKAIVRKHTLRAALIALGLTLTTGCTTAKRQQEQTVRQEQTLGQGQGVRQGQATTDLSELVFADTTVFADSVRLQQAFGSWADDLYALAHQDPEEAIRQAGRLISRANDRPQWQEKLYDFADMCFRDPNSTYRNEDFFISILQALIAAPNLDDIQKERPRYQLKKAMMNRPGTIASDVSYITREGKRGRLKNGKIETLKNEERGRIQELKNGKMETLKNEDASPHYLLLYFFNPECHDCGRVTGYLEGSKVYSTMVRDGRLTILAYYTDQDLGAWNRCAKDMPTEWIVARSQKASDREAYDLPAIPNLYLIGGDGRIILKDAPVEVIEDWLAAAR